MHTRCSRARGSLSRSTTKARIWDRDLLKRDSADGILTIGDRRLTIANPVTGDERSATYRIDPSRTPRRIDLFTRDDRILRGIYQFEGDNLVICLQPDESKNLPTGFSSVDGADLILIRVKALSRARRGRFKARLKFGDQTAARDDSRTRPQRR